MEVNDLRVQMYNKVSELSALSSPQLLSELCILDKKDYYKDIHCFDVITNNSHNYQLYVSKSLPRDILKQIIFLKDSPKILFLRGDSQSLVLEEKIQDRLNEYILFYDEKTSPYLPESYARNVMMDLIGSLEDYLKHKIIYDCFSPKNVVRVGEKWQFSTVGLVFSVDKQLPDYTHPEIKDPQKSMVYSLGALLFQMVFGFPFNDQQRSHPKLPISFSSYLPYLQYLQGLNKRKHLKIYYFIERIISISPQCLKILEQSLSGTMTLQEWKNHNYFTTPFKYKSQLDDRNRQLLMINSVEQKKMSIMLAAIQFKKKYPLQRLNKKPLPSPSDESYGQIIESYRKNYLLRNFSFAPEFERKDSLVKKDEGAIIGPSYTGHYFYQESFDPVHDYPCRELLKLIEKDKQDNPDYYSTEERGQVREAQLKLYAYPYAVAYQLMKVQNDQPIKIKRRIKQLVDLLLELSSLYLPSKLNPLHEIKSERFKEFSEMKAIYRESINELYRYLLTEAMRQYNVKKQAGLKISDRLKKREVGLEYYRLCLKLLQASLIVRKNGRDLNLTRIQTSQRKQIESDLQQLLRNYFPTKAELS